MPDHTHLLTDNARAMKDVLRFMNGISAKRVIDYLKAGSYESSLAKLRIQERANRYKHSVYEHHPNAFRVTGEDAFMEKVNYIHLNHRSEPDWWSILTSIYIQALGSGVGGLSRMSRWRLISTR